MHQWGEFPTISWGSGRSVSHAEKRMLKYHRITQLKHLLTKKLRPSNSCWNIFIEKPLCFFFQGFFSQEEWGEKNQLILSIHWYPSGGLLGHLDKVTVEQYVAMGKKQSAQLMASSPIWVSEFCGWSLQTDAGVLSPPGSPHKWMGFMAFYGGKAQRWMIWGYFYGFLRGTPSHHPFMNGIFHERKHPASLGYPHGTPLLCYLGCHVVLIFFDLMGM